MISARVKVIVDEYGCRDLCHANELFPSTLKRRKTTKTLGLCVTPSDLHAGEDPVDRKSHSGVSCTKHGSKTIAFGSASSQTLSIDG